jgi:hypothetical protein
VTPDAYVKVEPIAVLDTRALTRQDDIVTQWLVQWENLSADQSTWEDKLFMKATFPIFYFKTVKEWWSNSVSCGQEPAQGEGGGCPTLTKLGPGDSGTQGSCG